ncbi:MAG: glutamate--tRNA ligase family protein, partial [Planctomycetota bacterium]
ISRLNITHMAMSKRWLRTLVMEKHVKGWDDPRMPTLRGMRRRGYTADAIKKLCDTVGLAKTNSKVEIALLEHCVREDLNTRASRMMAVLDPLKVVITNYPEDGDGETFEFPWHPDQPDAGTRMVPFSREIFIERDDFREDPPKKFFRLAPGKEVRLRYAYFITCNEVIKDDAGNIVELRCTYDPASRGGESPDGRKVKGTLHWVSATKSADVEVRLYDHLFKDPNPGADRDWLEDLNPDSLKVVRGKVEPAMLSLEAGTHVQFERVGYFVVDTVDSTPGVPVFNRTVALKDSWAKIEKREAGG